MELYQIRHFVAVVETGSFTKGAQREAVSQPAISVSIAKLEAELEVKLLERRRSSVVATPAGMRLFDAGKAMLRLGNAVKAELKALDKPNLLKIGVLRSFSSQRVSRLLTSFKRTSAPMAIEVFDSSNEHLIELLAEKKLDAIFTILDGRIESFASRVLFSEPYFLAVPDEHRLAQQQVIRVSDLDNEPFITRTGFDTFQDGITALAARGVRIRVVYQTDEFDRTLALVAARIGLALVPGNFEMPAVKFLPVSDLDMVRKYGLLWRPEHKGRDVEKFFEFAKAHAWSK
ncbi:LysR family transcriptional regulator [Methylocapsa acidiphila]|uniref:LysR family transcriptional regulator n=1 Tax=Methylocapsa acidiphila TaxID=133552 RepID=UPI000409390F|nr:LysR family transcriptional regulator [Methylocapsa acidiphila]